MGWTGDAESAERTLTVVIDGNKTLTSVFGALPGESLWHLDLDGGIQHTAAMDANGILYVGTRNQKLYAVKTTETAVNWTVPLESEVAGNITLGHDGQLFFISANSALSKIAANLSVGIPLFSPSSCT